MRADVAIRRMRASPLRTKHSRRLRSRQGSCTKKRRGVPADGAPGRTFTSRPAPLPWQQVPSDREPRPTKGPSVLDRPPAATPNLARRRGLGIAEAFHDAWRGASVVPRPPWTGRQVLVRATWPSIPTTEASAAEPRRPKPPAPDDLPWEGQQPPANARHPGSPLQGRLKAGNAARRFRVLGGRVSRVCVRNNRGEGGRKKNPVSKSDSHAQFGVGLSPERSTNPGYVDLHRRES